MIYRQLLTIIYQNENYILIKLEHPSLCSEGCSYYYFFLFSINMIELFKNYFQKIISISDNIEI